VGRQGAAVPRRDDPALDSTCFKSIQTDRVIGDRRARNAIEGPFQDPPALCPQQPSFLLWRSRAGAFFDSALPSDRKDFYHQIKTSVERTKANVCFPPLKVSDLEGATALSAWNSSAAAGRKKRYDKLKHGDFLGRPMSFAAKMTIPLIFERVLPAFRKGMLLDLSLQLIATGH